MTLDERLNLHLYQSPTIAKDVFIAQGAVILGNVTIHEKSSVWFHSTIRADINRIEIGPCSNIQDGSVIHLADDYSTVVGEFVTCGHRAILHACTIGNEVLIGMGATILDGTEIGSRCIIGANALVTGGTKIPDGSLVLGSPAKVVRSLDSEQQSSIKTWASKYVELSRAYLARPPQITAWTGS